MNFLTGGSENGWDEDDDDLGEFVSADDDDEYTETSSQAAARVEESTMAVAASDEENENDDFHNSNSGGMLMGRLSRFLEAVTQPEETEDEDEDTSNNAWDEDSFDVDNDEEQDTESSYKDGIYDEPSNSGVDHYDDAVGYSTEEPPSPVFPLATRPVQAEVQASLQAPGLMDQGEEAVADTAGGWDDDLLEMSDTTHNPLSPNPVLPGAATRNVSFGSNVQVAPVPNRNDASQQASMFLGSDVVPEPSLVPQVSALTVDPATEQLDGWAHDSGGLPDGSEGAQPFDTIDQLPNQDSETPDDLVRPQSILGGLVRSGWSAIAQAVDIPVSSEDEHLMNSDRQLDAPEDGWGDDEEDIDGIDDEHSDEHNELPLGTSILNDTADTVIDSSSNTSEDDMDALQIVETASDDAAVGWDDDDGDLAGLDYDSDNLPPLTPMDAPPDSPVPAKLVDLTPPPPLPPKDITTGGTAGAIAASGWDDDLDVDDEDDNEVDVDFDGHSAQTPLVDHTPPPPLPSDRLHGEATGLAVGDDDDFSRDDTLSMTNSRPMLGFDDDDLTEGASNSLTDRDTRMVDHTPIVSDRASTRAESLAAIVGTSACSIGGDSLESRSLEESRRSMRGRRMVDKTPATRRKVVDHTPPARLSSRGDMSLAVAGQISIADSLESIDEEDEEDEEEAREYTAPLVEQDAGPERPARVNLVDHTPIPMTKSQSIAASVNVFVDADSEEGDLGESDDGLDDVKEDLYGQVVDHTPATPNAGPKALLNSSSCLGGEIPTEDDTVLGVAEKQDVEVDFKLDDDMDDESTRGDEIETMEDFENRSLISSMSVRLAIPEERHLVDHVPFERKASSTLDGSVMVVADDSSFQRSSPVGNDDGNEEALVNGFGPIVDHTPSVTAPPSGMSVATSVVTQTSGVARDIQEDDDMDNTVGIGSTSVAEDSWNRLVPLKGEDDDRVVDHIPKRAPKRSSVDQSVCVMVDANDDFTQVDTIVEDAAVDFGPIVDHTPFSTRSVARSIAASLATQESLEENDNKGGVDFDNLTGVSAGDGWDNEVPLDDNSADGQDQVPAVEDDKLVDHVPRRSFSRPTDASTMVAVDPLDAVSEINAEADGTDGARFGPVVDQIPDPLIGSIPSLNGTQASKMAVADDIQQDDEMDGTWYGASTVGGVSTVGNSGGGSTDDDSDGGSGWDDDADALTGLETPQTIRETHQPDSPLVDHIPPISSPCPISGSIAVQIDPSVVSSTRDEDNIDQRSFGAVVDVTPAHPPRSLLSVANSMATLATGIETDIKRDEEMDEATWNGGISVQEDGWDADDAELEAIADAEDDEMPHLVDHVPERPASRPTDASTVVAAAPSEMNSQGDDFGNDEQCYGPVVDQTPLTPFNTLPSAAGSTIVAMHSVADDDLDDAVENAIDGDNAVVAVEENGWQDETPNPQSGNDDDSDREQLVDYVPPTAEEESLPDLVRDGSSEMATVGEKSLLPADEQKEDEYGPVVDHTPIPTSPLATPDSAAFVPQKASDQVSSPGSMAHGGLHVASVAPQFSEASEEKENDGLEEEEFGPVVDQLPTSSSRASLPASRGGSTVDALATVSEADDDLGAGDGWEEDTEISLRENSLTTLGFRINEDKNLSVKWVDRLNKADSAAFLQKGLPNQDGNPPNPPEESRLSLNETRYFDPESVDTNGWNDSLNLGDTGLEDEDLTPPSTPRSGFRETPHVVQPSVPLLPGGETDTKVDCSSCAEATGDECPCVSRLLSLNEGSDGFSGTLQAPDGRTIQVNFEELLQAEGMKRTLLQTEIERLRSELKRSDSIEDYSGPAAVNEQESLNQKLAEQLRESEQQRMTLLSNNHKLKESGFDSVERISELENHNSQLLAQRDKLIREEAELKSSNEQTLASSEQSAASEISRLKQELSQHETECENLRGKNHSLLEDLDSFRELNAKLEEEKIAWASRESLLVDKAKALHESLLNTSSSQDVELELKGIISTAQQELESKATECADLLSSLETTQQQLVMADAENGRVQEELVRTTTVHEAELAQTQDAANQKFESMEKRIVDLEASEAEQYRIATEMQASHAEQLRFIDKELTDRDRARVLEEEKASKIGTELRSTLLKMKTIAQEKTALATQVTTLDTKAKRADEISVELLAMTQERDLLKEELSTTTATVSDLQSQVTSSGPLSLELQDSQRAWLHEKEAVHAQLEDAKEILGEYKSALDESEKEKSRLTNESVELQRKYEELRTNAEQHPEGNADSFPSNQQALALQQELELALTAQKTSEEEQQFWNNRCTGVEAELKNTMEMMSRSNLESNSVRLQLEDAQNSVESLRAERETIVSDKEKVILKLNHAEDLVATLQEQAKDRTTELASKTAILDSLKAGDNEYVGRIHTLEKELQDVAIHLQEERKCVIALRQEISARDFDLANAQRDYEELSSQLASAEDEGDSMDELLVELVAYKEEVDLNEEKLAATIQEVADRDASLEALRQKLEDQEKKSEDLKTEMYNRASTLSGENEAMLAVLKENHDKEMADLQAIIEKVSGEKDMAMSSMSQLQNDDSKLREENTLLETQLAEAFDEGKSKETQLLAVIEGTEAQRIELSDKCYAQENEMARIQNLLEEKEQRCQEVTGLKLRLDELGEALTESNEIAEQRNAAIHDLQAQLQSLREIDTERSPVAQDSADVVTLRRAIEDMKKSAETKHDDMVKLNTVYLETTERLKMTMEELSTSELLNNQLQGDVEKQNAMSTTIDTLERKLESAEQRRKESTEEAAAFREESANLKVRLSVIEEELREVHTDSQQSKQEPTGEASTEIFSLRQQVAQLHQQQVVATTERSDLERATGREIETLKLELNRKDGQLRKMETDIGSLGTDLSSSRTQMARKDKQVEDLEKDILALKLHADQLAAASQVLEVNNTGTESKETLRSHIIMLAQALERSEGHRADTIGNLERERQSNADSLRRLRESVKRFYSTLSCGEN